MPGHMLSAECPCGFTGGVNVGVTEPVFGPDSQLLVAAYDPEQGSLVSIDAKEAKKRNLTVFEDPYAYDPFKLVLEGDLSAAPEGDKTTFICPKCGKNTLRFYRFGFWD